MKLKAFTRKIASILLAVLTIMCLTGISYAETTTTAAPSTDVTADTVARAGTETLYKGTGSIGSFYLGGTNLTPVKTMGASGTFSLFGTAEGSSSTYWQICVQIRDAYTGTILAKDYTTGSSYNFQYYSMEISVTKGQKIQIYTYYTSSPSTESKIFLNYTLE